MHAVKVIFNSFWSTLRHYISGIDQSGSALKRPWLRKCVRPWKWGSAKFNETWSEDIDLDELLLNQVSTGSIIPRSKSSVVLSWFLDLRVLSCKVVSQVSQWGLYPGLSACFVLSNTLEHFRLSALVVTMATSMPIFSTPNSVASLDC